MKVLPSYPWPKECEPTEPIDKAALFASLPPEWPDEGLLIQIRERLERARQRLVVLDDDPLGTQATHGILVVLYPDEETLSQALQAPGNIFYLITNSRSLPEECARKFYGELAGRLYRLAAGLGVDIQLLCRSDSTLRGHFPAEVEALEAVHREPRGCGYDGIVLAPFMGEGGRYTIGDVQWVEEGEKFIPAAQSEFARDPIFAYCHSNIPLWIEEKGGGKADEILAMSLEDIRLGGPKRVTNLLEGAAGGRIVILNAASYRDLEVAVAGLMRAEEQGKVFLSWTAASFIRVRSGRGERALLSAQEIYGSHSRGGHGLVVVGSYGERSSRQLAQALKLSRLAAFELPTEEILDVSRRSEAVVRLRRLSREALAHTDVLIYTSRAPVRGASREENLRIGQEIGRSLAEVAQGIVAQGGLRFLVAKGGATAYQLATQALGAKSAWALGQVQPGVPLWLLGELPFVVFPGNVGEDQTLAQVITTLRGDL